MQIDLSTPSKWQGGLKRMWQKEARQLQASFPLSLFARALNLFRPGTFWELNFVNCSQILASNCNYFVISKVEAESLPFILHSVTFRFAAIWKCIETAANLNWNCIKSRRRRQHMRLSFPTKCGILSPLGYSPDTAPRKNVQKPPQNFVSRGSEQVKLEGCTKRSQKRYLLI